MTGISTRTSKPRPAELEPATWPAYGLTTLTVVPLVWRRRAPLTVLLAILATSGLYRVAVEGPGQPLPYTGLVIVYTIAMLAPPWQRLVTALLMAVAVPWSVWLNTQSARELTFSLFVFAAAYVFGRLTVTRRRADRVEAEQAAARERARIAREMHDILSHAVSLMIVQAEAGPVAVRTAPERAEAAFDAISETGRDAMAQLRRMLGVLREGDGPGESPRAPQPDIAALHELVERVRASGLDVGYETSGGVRTLSAATGATVYRIVQEALTNVVRHAHARSASVRLRYAEGVVGIVVSDDGRGAQPGSAGHGLVGIRERAAAHGGTAVTGPGPDGRGFEVRVEIPVIPVTSGAEVGS
ncbi:sensor histidine kinase [Streptomyces sp. MS191]|uniref:sensor histidine kinase n=1 Tax=Streptomyces sp. ms191 TaxID=1827978 RepID=UPI0021C9C9AC|nr:histidine kinase [Streptomyces sp. ms191]